MKSNRPLHLRIAAVTGTAVLAIAGAQGVSHAQDGSLGGNLGLNLDLLLGSTGPGGTGSADGSTGSTAGAAAVGVNAVIVSTGSLGEYEVVLPDGVTLPPLPFIN